MTISKKGVSNGDPFELIKLAFLTSESKLKTEFNKVKIKIDSEKDLEFLANLAKSKADISGVIKDGGNVIMFNTMDVVNSIRYSPEEKQAVIDKKNDTSIFPKE